MTANFGRKILITYTSAKLSCYIKKTLLCASAIMVCWKFTCFLVILTTILSCNVNVVNGFDVIDEDEAPPFIVTLVFCAIMGIIHIYYFIEFTDYSLQHIYATAQQELEMQGNSPESGTGAGHASV